MNKTQHHNFIHKTQLFLVFVFVIGFFVTHRAQAPGGYTTGLRFWIKGDAGTFSDAGTTPSTNNTALRQWNDQSGNANHAGQATAALRPTFFSSVSNGNPGARFNTTHFMDASVSTSISGTSDYCGFFVLKLTSAVSGLATDGSGSYVLDRTTATNELYGMKVVTSGGTQRFLFQKRNNSGGNLGGPVSTSVIDNANFQIITMERIYNSGGNTLSRIYVNGVLEATQTNASETTTPPIMRIGRHATAASGGMVGDLTEIAMYNNSPSSAVRQRIESYLAIKYGISLYQTTLRNYFSSGGTVIYPATTTHSAYVTTITGIGRDDASGLNQSNSRNQSTLDLVRVQNPSSLGDGDFLLWGHNNGGLIIPNSADVAAPISARLSRVWRVAHTGNVGTVSITFDLSSIPGTKFESHLRLLIDRDGDGFADNDVAPVTGTLVGNDFTVSGITLQDGDFFTVGTTNSSSTPLPIELGSFELSCLPKDKTLVQWNTLSERNTENFTVERAADGMNYSEVAQVTASENSTSLKNYSVIDENPLKEINYYRLKQTDKNGEFEYFLPKAIHCHSIVDRFVIYPNPNNGLVFIENNGASVYATISNVLGTTLKSFFISAGKNQLDLLEFGAGIYLLEINCTSEKHSRQIIVLGN